MKKCDFVINALPSYVEKRGKDILVNLKILEFCLKVGVNYLDLACYGDYRRKIVEQLSLNKKFEQEKLVGLINAGISPGLTNGIVKEAIFEDEKIRVGNLEFPPEDSLIQSSKAHPPLGNLLKF